jgi:hypothetical protein
MPPITAINALEWRITVISTVTGVDTHARTHTYAVINTITGARDCCEAFPVISAGMKRAIAWIGRNTGPVPVAVEGTASYGASLTRALSREDNTVVEVKPPRTQARVWNRHRGKADGRFRRMRSAVRPVPRRYSGTAQPPTTSGVARRRNAGADPAFHNNYHSSIIGNSGLTVAVLSWARQVRYFSHPGQLRTPLIRRESTMTRP